MAVIGKINADGDFEFINCSNDTYDRYVGKMLYYYYDTLPTINKLLKFGDIDTIYPYPKVMYEKDSYNITTQNHPVKKYSGSAKGNLKNILTITDKVYVFKNGKWYTTPTNRNIHTPEKLIEVTRAVAEHGLSGRKTTVKHKQHVPDICTQLQRNVKKMF